MNAISDQSRLSGIRQEIDAIDDQLLRLLNQRAQCAKTVADIKTAAGEVECFHRPEREVEVLRRMMADNPGPLSAETVARFFREVMSECLALEKPLDVAYLGPEGTFTQQAAYRHFGHAIHAVPYASIDAIFRAVESAAVIYGVVPVENSTEGVIAHTLDSFLQTPLVIAGEVSLRIHHNLLGLTHDLSQIKEVCSHQQSLGQCRQWLDKNLPGVPRIAVASNAEAARLASLNPEIAAIAGEAAASVYGLEKIAPMIEDESNNTTRFLVVGRTPVGSTGHDKTSILLTIPNDPGALYGMLEPFARHGISLSKIESRPSRKDVWDYVFFVDVDGHRDDPVVAAAITEVTSRATMLKILGSYPKALN
jgi:chorismate mutase / prephenate dehydratase